MVMDLNLNLTLCITDSLNLILLLICFLFKYNSIKFNINFVMNHIGIHPKDIRFKDNKTCNIFNNKYENGLKESQF